MTMMRKCIGFLSLLVGAVQGWTISFPTPHSSPLLLGRRGIGGGKRGLVPATTPTTTSTTRTNLAVMGLFDQVSNFLQNRQGDFMKLENSDTSVFGPGPLLVAYGIPNGIDDDEIYDMLEDAAPRAFATKQCKVVRLPVTATSKENDSKDDSIFNLSLQQALETMFASSSSSWVDHNDDDDNNIYNVSSAKAVPVLLFSGFRNDEMMAVYNVLGGEIYQETAGQVAAACAKAVPNAMTKPLRQVLDEISGDHQDALGNGGNRKN